MVYLVVQDYYSTLLDSVYVDRITIETVLKRHKNTFTRLHAPLSVRRDREQISH